ncbi:MAG: RHS repeat protein, partial [Planctomycetales bacterium]|nr:RHS repeat protein [Planctomycetales bacterium]
YGYNDGGDLIRMTDPLGHTTRYEYDVRGRRIQAIDPDGGITSFEYDPDNNLIALTDAVGNRTEFTYDARSRQTSEIDPLGNVIAYEYDAVDNLIRKTDRLGRVTLYEYDTLDRLTSETWLGGANLIQYQYDIADNLLSIQDGFSHLSYQYDALDRVTQVDNTGTPDAPHVVLDYAYDVAGNVVSVTDSIEGTPNGQTAYAYDALHRLQTLTQTAAPGAVATASAFVPSDKRVDFAYNQLSQYTQVNRFNDLLGTDLAVRTNYAYDTLNRLTSIDHLDTTATPVSFFHYQYDTASRITQITDVSGPIAYDYDDRDQLTGALYSDPNRTDESYSYDANGNRLESHLHGNGYLTGTANRLLSDGTYNYEYDAEGNTVLRTEIATGATREFQWDHRNRLISVTDRDADGTATQVVRFVYDAFDRRIAKHVDLTLGDAQDGTILYFVYDREDVILDMLDPDGFGPEQPSVDQRYLHGAAIDEVLAQESSDVAAWLIADHLGTIQAAVTSIGDLTTFVYDAYGKRTVAGELEIRYGFTGREQDDVLELSYFRARYYSSEIGRFLNEDPLGFAKMGLNLSSYVKNEPLRFTDPYGLDRVQAAQSAAQRIIDAIGNDSTFREFVVDPNYNWIPYEQAGMVRNMWFKITLPEEERQKFICSGISQQFNAAFKRAQERGEIPADWIPFQGPRGEGTFTQSLNILLGRGNGHFTNDVRVPGVGVINFDYWKSLTGKPQVTFAESRI